jgi:hypothetical protein
LRQDVFPETNPSIGDGEVDSSMLSGSTIFPDTIVDPERQIGLAATHKFVMAGLSDHPTMVPKRRPFSFSQRR